LQTKASKQKLIFSEYISRYIKKTTLVIRLKRYKRVRIDNTFE